MPLFFTRLSQSFLGDSTSFLIELLLGRVWVLSSSSQRQHIYPLGIKTDTDTTINSLKLGLSKCVVLLTSLGCIKESLSFIASENTALAQVKDQEDLWVYQGLQVYVLFQHNQTFFFPSVSLECLRADWVRHAAAGSPRPHLLGQRPDSTQPQEKSSHILHFESLQQGTGACSL